jgi:uncharacterized membrane-anchored protein YitT (DUF2179 family)
MKNFNLKKFAIDLLIYAAIFSILMNFIEYHNWKKSITAGLFYGLFMAIFNSLILPKLQKKK